MALTSYIEKQSQKTVLKSTCHGFFKVIIALSCCLLVNVVRAQTEDGSQPISIRFQDAPVRVILQALADHENLNLIVPDSVNMSLTIRLEQVEWQQALNIILNLSQLEAQIKDGVMMIIPQSELISRRQKLMEDRRLLEQQKPLALLKIIIEHHDLNQLIALLEKQKGSVLSARALISAEPRTNSVLIQDLHEKLPEIKSFVQSLDLAQQQIQITAHIVTMSQEGLKELGVKWGLDGTKEIGLSHISTNLPSGAATSEVGFNLAKISGRLLSLELSALELENQLEFIASPRLLTLNDRIATIKQGTELPYEVASGLNGATAIEFKSAVLGLEVTPRILPNDKVNLILTISQNTPGRTIKQSNGGEVLAIDTQEIKTQVIVGNNETLVLGGVFQQRKEESLEKVPILGSIPVIGKIFSRQSHKQSRRELIIFITPTLVDI